MIGLSLPREHAVKIATLSIAIALVVIGAGAKLAYDAHREQESCKRMEELSTGVTCSLCAAHKADLERLRAYKAQRSLLEERADPDVE